MKGRILVVEDENSQREMLVEKLSFNGFTISEAKDGLAGLRKIGREQFDLIITDLQMPKMNGLDMIKEVRRKKPNLPIILITGYADLEAAIEAINFGVEGLFKKPIEMEELISKINTCFVHQRISDILMQSAKMSGLGELTASVAHELRNALAEIKMAGGLLQKLGGLHKGHLNYLEKMTHGVNRSDRIIGHLLDFSRRSEKKMVVNLDKLFTVLLTLVDDKIRLQSITVERDIGDVHVDGVEDSLNIIFLNLILNAIQAMKAGGTLKIGVRQNGKTQVMISDTGCGIPREIQNEVFDIFYTTKGEKGNGLGLSLVKKEVEKMGGDIKLKSTVGEGSTFAVTLPGAGLQGSM